MTYSEAVAKAKRCNVDIIRRDGSEDYFNHRNNYSMTQRDLDAYDWDAYGWPRHEGTRVYEKTPLSFDSRTPTTWNECVDNEQRAELLGLAVSEKWGKCFIHDVSSGALVQEIQPKQPIHNILHCPKVRLFLLGWDSCLEMINKD